MTAISAEAHKSLIDAILNNNEEFVEDFIKTAAVLSDKENPNLETDQFLRDRRMDPLHAAVMKGHVGLIALLVETGFSDVNARAETTSVNDFSMTALHRAVLHQQPEAIESLLQLGAVLLTLVLNTLLITTLTNRRRPKSPGDFPRCSRRAIGRNSG